MDIGVSNITKWTAHGKQERMVTRYESDDQLSVTFRAGSDLDLHADSTCTGFIHVPRNHSAKKRPVAVQPLYSVAGKLYGN